MFLTDEEVVRLTGYSQFAGQRRVLLSEGIPFTLNKEGRPIVTRKALERSEKAKPEYAQPNLEVWS